jgi:glycerol uptake facilitator-like aquaporin
LLAESIGVAGIVAVVTGASFMAANLAADPAADLLINAVATGGALFVLISIFMSISGSHFNPVVTLVMLLQKSISSTLAIGYLVAQLFGAAAGAVLANLMFENPAIELSEKLREGTNLYLGETIATFGLVLLILLLVAQQNQKLIPAAVSLWIVSAYFFTSSTSFANPAVAFGRSLSDTGSSIALTSVPGFVAAQLLGGILAVIVFRILQPTKKVKS